MEEDIDIICLPALRDSPLSIERVDVQAVEVCEDRQVEVDASRAPSVSVFWRQVCLLLVFSSGLHAVVLLRPVGLTPDRMRSKSTLSHKNFGTSQQEHCGCKTCSSKAREEKVIAEDKKAASRTQYLTREELEQRVTTTQTRDENAAIISHVETR